MKNSLKNLGIFIILFFIFLYKDIFYLIPLKVLNINFDTLSYNMQIFLSICSSLILVIIFIIIYYKYLKEKFIEYKKNISNFLDLGLKYYLVGLFGMFIFNILIMLFSPVKEANNEVLVQEMLKKAPILSFISASILAPFLEEMLFRKSFGDILKIKK